MRDAVNSYQADNAGINPDRLIRVRRYYSGPPEHFARCPADLDLGYSYDRESGDVTCPNPEHRPR